MLTHTHPIALTMFVATMILAVASPRYATAIEREPYVWRNVAIGGGGALPNLVLHPKVKDLAYLCPDVSVPYRWDEADHRWVPLADFFRSDERYKQGCDALAVDPTDATGNTLYLVAGSNLEVGKGEIMKSIDRGRTWQRNKAAVWAWSNGLQLNPQRLVVDPANPSVLYYGGREGLMHSTDAGETWQPHPTAPVGHVDLKKKGGGVLMVAIDPTRGVTDQSPARSRTIYLSVQTTPSEDVTGLYRSSDGGTSWTPMPDGPRGVRRAVFDSTATLYATSRSGLHRYTADRWQEISPNPKSAYNAIAVDPRDDRHLLLSTHWWGFWCAMYRSVDAGATWAEIKDEHDRVVPWYPRNHVRSSTFAVAFDPFTPGRVWYSDWYLPRRTDDITGSTVRWNDLPWGLEEVCTVGNMASPPSGSVALFSGLADCAGFAHTSLTEYPQRQLSHGLKVPFTVTSIDYAEHDPSQVVITGTKLWHEPGGAAFSTDGGRTFSDFPTLPIAEPRGGRVAMAADGGHIVWATGGGEVFWTGDRGATWARSTGVPGNLTDNLIFRYNQPLAADRRDASRFYAYRGGKVWRSDDGGRSFARTPARVPDDNYDHSLLPNPATSGDLWLQVGAFEKGRLFRSTDAGDAFVPVDGVDVCVRFAFGKGRSGGDGGAPGTPALYVFGKVAGDPREGIFRSDDLAVTWTRVDVETPYPGNVNNMTADRQVYGRVYVGTGGRGILYGEPAQAK